MYSNTHKAFTMVELIFAIIIIGILSAVAVPKFSKTSEVAYVASAKSEIASARTALATLRQKNILKGETAELTIADVGANFTNLLQFPVKSCSGSKCNGWQTTIVGGGDPSFVYHGQSGDATFVLTNNTLQCTSSSTNKCNEYE